MSHLKLISEFNDPDQWMNFIDNLLKDSVTTDQGRKTYNAEFYHDIENRIEYSKTNFERSYSKLLLGSAGNIFKERCGDGYNAAVMAIHNIQQHKSKLKRTLRLCANTLEDAAAQINYNQLGRSWAYDPHFGLAFVENDACSDPKEFTISAEVINPNDVDVINTILLNMSWNEKCTGLHNEYEVRVKEHTPMLVLDIRDRWNGTLPKLIINKKGTA